MCYYNYGKRGNTMKYEVRMNGKYMNRFKRYGEAVDLRDQLARRFPKARVEIIAL
jgi:hypothetical protein